MPAILSIRGVSHAYGDGPTRRQVLDGVSAEIAPGEIVIVTGPSGSGKTTLLTLAGGLRSLQAGSIVAMGSELYGASYDALVTLRERIGFVFQAHNLLPALTARQNVQMALRGSRAPAAAESRKRAIEVLGAVGLEQHLDSYPHELSGGQRQRVAIARALVRNPSIVLADEPTASLDRQSGRAIVDLLHTLVDRHACAILLVTHDNRIIDVADRILTLEDGQLSSEHSGLAEHTALVLSALQRRGDLQRLAMPLDSSDFVSLVDGFSREFTELGRTLDAARDDAMALLVDETLDTIARKLRQIFRAERASAYVPDREGRMLLSPAALHNGADGVRVSIPVGEGPAGLAAARRDVVHQSAADGTLTSLPHAGALRGCAPRDVLAAPVLAADGSVAGVIEVVNRAAGDAFTAAERQAFADVAVSLVPVLSRCVPPRRDNFERSG